MRIILAVAAFILLISCSSKENANLQAQSSNLSATKQTARFETLSEINLSFSKQCSNAYCGAYELSIHDSTLAVTKSKEKFTRSMEVQGSKKFLPLLNALKLTRMKTQIMPGKDDCLSYATEGSTYLLQLGGGDFQQELQIYSGCQGLDEKYSHMIEMFDALAINSQVR